MKLDDLHLHDLIALQRALLEARFPRLENDQDVWIAPFVTGLLAEVVEEMRRRYLQEGNRWQVEQLDDWLDWNSHYDNQKTFFRRVKNSTSLRLLIHEQPELVREILSPFRVDDEALTNILHFVRRENERESSELTDP